MRAWTVVCGLTFLGIGVMSGSLWAETPNGGGNAARDVFSALMTEGGHAHLQQVVNLNRREVNRMILDSLAEQTAVFSELRAQAETMGVEANVMLQVTLAPGVTVLVAAEDLPAAALWDGRSPPDFCFSFKMEAKSTDDAPVGYGGSIEVSYDPSAPRHGIKEIKFEGEKSIGAVSDRVSVTITDTADGPSVEIEYGKSAGTSNAFQDRTGWGFEAEQSIGVDFGRSADDLYADDMQRSDWAIVRATEDLIARITWGISVSAEHEKKFSDRVSVVTGGKYSLGTDQIRDLYTRWIFSETDRAADELDRMLDRQAAWRRDRIEAEARRLGIDPAGKPNADLIKEVGDARRARGITDPVFRTGSQARTDAAARGPDGGAPLTLPPGSPPPGGPGRRPRNGQAPPTLPPFR